jgi:hypothetical protein
LNAKLHFRGGVDSIISGGDKSNFYPFGNGVSPVNFPEIKVQLLYPAEFVKGSGYITGVAMTVNEVTTDEIYTYTMRLGHSTLTDLTSDFEGNFSGSPVTVASNAILNVPAGIPAGAHVWIPMPDGKFNYNGTDNLIVEIHVTSASGNTKWRNKMPASYVSRATDDTFIIGTDTHQHDIAFRFKGGTMDVIELGGPSNSFPFSSSVGNRQQFLYRAADLGTGGTINKIALRLTNDSVADDYTNFKVVMSHSDLTTGLSLTFDDNLNSPVTVHNGTFSIPAGLKAGDWLDIPLTTPFVYDGTSSIVIETVSDAGSATQGTWRTPDDAVRWLDCYPYASVSTATNTSINADRTALMRFWLK